MSDAREELRLVTDFAELRPGILVVCKGCFHCGRDHRGILRNGVDTLSSGTVYPLEPNTACAIADDGVYAVRRAGVEKRQVYRVVDAIPGHEMTRKRERQLVRTR